MPTGLGPGIAVTGTSGFRIRKAACSEDNIAGSKTPGSSLDGFDQTIVNQQVFHLTGGANLNTGITDKALQGSLNIFRLAALRKNAPAPLNLQRNVALLKKSHHIIDAKGVECRQ